MRMRFAVVYCVSVVAVRVSTTFAVVFFLAVFFVHMVVYDVSYQADSNGKNKKSA